MNYAEIPNELKAIPRWVCVWHNSKTPMQATCCKGASSTNPDTWSTYEQAITAVKDGVYDNVGFVFADDGIVGIDIDCGFDTDGFLSMVSINCMQACKSYTEISRSHRGIHILVRGNLPFNGKNNRSGVEIYKTGRYFILTGDMLIYDKIVENQSGIDFIVNTYFAEVMRESTGTVNPRIYSPVYKPPENGRISLNPTYPPVLPGARNISMTSLAGQLHSQGYDKAGIYREVCRANQAACKPPLPDRELEAIINSVTKYRR